MRDVASWHETEPFTIRDRIGGLGKVCFEVKSVTEPSRCGAAPVGLHVSHDQGPWGVARASPCQQLGRHRNVTGAR